MDVQVTTLANGLRVASDPMPHLHTASVGIWVDAGSRHESADNNGVAHMLEHMAFKGTERRSAVQIAEEIEAVGGHLNAYTSREQTCYYARIMQDDLPLALDILADIVLHSTFDEAELARERAVVMQEIGQAEDTPDDIVFDHLQAVSFPDQAMGRSILGSTEGVAGMSRDMLLDFMQENYRPGRMVVAASGAVDHATVVAQCGELFGDLKGGGTATPEPARYAGGEHREDRELEQVHLTMAVPGVDYHDPDFYAAQVMSTVLGGDMSSRLFQEVRERRGLCYSVFTYASSFVDGGLFGIYAGTGAEEIAELAPVIIAEMARLADDAGEEEVARARAQLKTSLMMALESPSARSEQLARQMLIFGAPKSPEEVIAAVDGIDADRVRQVAGRLFAGATPALAALGPVGRLADYDSLRSGLAA